MLSVVLDNVNHVAVLEMDGPLSERDFCSAATKVDLIVDEVGKLSGIIIRAKAFPGWESIAAVISHLRFMKDQHKRVPRVALVTASIVAHLAEIFSTHFVNAEIRIFSYYDLDKANQWVTGK
jgi:hypothetical protein